MAHIDLCARLRLCLLRTMTVNGLILLTATPLQGLTKLMLEYLPELAPVPEPAPAPIVYAHE